MKKRSLFAAVAMLVVSAIVLTSATFAWFNLSNNAAVDQLELTVESGSGLYLSVDNGTTWVSQVTSANILAAIDKQSLPVLVPVDFDGSTSLKKMIDRKLDDTASFGAATINVDYLEYELMIKSPDACTVTLGDSVFSGTAQDILYLSFNNKLFSADGNGAYSALPAGLLDTTYLQLANDIYTGTGVRAQTISATALTAETITLAANTPFTITVRLFVEGQDADCIGAHTGGDARLTLAFEKVTTP